MTIRVVIADDEELVREGLVAIVASQADLEVVGTAADGDEAVAVTAAHRPDVVLMDVRMPRTDGIDATRRILAADDAVRVLVLTTVEDDEVVYAALGAGASGFLLKSIPRDRLWEGIRGVAAGDLPLAPAVARRLVAAHLAAGGRAPRPDLLHVTDRQADVLRLLARGLANHEIAAELFLAESTVKGYVSEMLARHGLRDRTQLVVLAYEAGLVEPGGL